MLARLPTPSHTNEHRTDSSRISDFPRRENVFMWRT
jgi:hypothetical protein